jgi:hypothetical protein
MIGITAKAVITHKGTGWFFQTSKVGFETDSVWGASTFFIAKGKRCSPEIYS